MRVKSDSNGSGDAKWEGGDNHKFTIPSDGTAAVSVVVEWGGEIEAEADPADMPAPQQQQREERRGREERRRDGGSSSSDEGGGSDGSTVVSVGSSFDDSMALLPQWQGKELRFMQSNEHTRWAGGGVGWGWGGGEGVLQSGSHRWAGPASSVNQGRRPAQPAA